MKKYSALLFLLVFGFAFSQNQISGKVVQENYIPLPGVLVVNIDTGKQSSTDVAGNFSIEATENQEIRFIKNSFYRSSLKINRQNFDVFNQVVLEKIPVAIEEVDVSFKPSGDLSKDSKKLAKTDKTEALQKEIGVPKPPEKPREKPAEIKQVLLPILLGQLNVQGVYDLVSGKARRQKNLYKFEDLQENLQWIRSRIDDDYFIKGGIPKERISEFLLYSFAVKPEILRYVKVRNIASVQLKLDEVMPNFVAKLKS